VKITKFYLSLLSVLAIFFSVSAKAERIPSETIDGRKGVFRLISADVNNQGDYFFRTGLEYFEDSNALKNSRDVTGTKATVSFGYVLFPELLLTGSGGFNISTLEVGNFNQDYIIAGFQMGATWTTDLGKIFNLEPNRLLAGATLMVDLSKPKRIVKGIGVQPKTMITLDYADLEPVGVRTHFNLGVNPTKVQRYFDPKKVDIDGLPFYRDFDYFAFRANSHVSIPVAFGMEFPFSMINPSFEIHWDYVFSTKFNEQPKWATVGLKARPFPQDNFEIFGGADIRISQFKATALTARPDTHSLPLWNAILGFGISQFGKRSNEVAIDGKELTKIKDQIRERNDTLYALKSDLGYNTVTGRVTDAETKQPMSGVIISFPEQPQIRRTVTNDKGEFTRYFPNLAGSRMVFSKEDFADSTKFLALKPGESVKVEIELAKGGIELIGDLQVAITKSDGTPVVAAEILIGNEALKIENKGTTDSAGNFGLKLPEGEYSLEIRAAGFVTRKDIIQVKANSAVVRAYSLTGL